MLLRSWYIQINITLKKLRAGNRARVESSLLARMMKTPRWLANDVFILAAVICFHQLEVSCNDDWKHLWKHLWLMSSDKSPIMTSFTNRPQSEWKFSNISFSAFLLVLTTVALSYFPCSWSWQKKGKPNLIPEMSFHIFLIALIHFNVIFFVSVIN